MTGYVPLLPTPVRVTRRDFRRCTLSRSPIGPASNGQNGWTSPRFLGKSRSKGRLRTVNRVVSIGEMTLRIYGFCQFSGSERFSEFYQRLVGFSGGGAGITSRSRDFHIPGASPVDTP